MGFEKFYILHCTLIHKHDLVYISMWIRLRAIFELNQQGMQFFPLCMKYLVILKFIEDFLYIIYLHTCRESY